MSVVGTFVRCVTNRASDYLSDVSPTGLQIICRVRHQQGFRLSVGCVNNRTSDSMNAGALPAVEMKSGLGGHTDSSCKDDMEAGLSAIKFLQKQVDLDGSLDRAASADCEAFNCFVDSRLADAVRYSLWCEWASLSQLPVRVQSHCILFPWVAQYELSDACGAWALSSSAVRLDHATELTEIKLAEAFQSSAVLH
jgi:hypothetical protein